MPSPQVSADTVSTAKANRIAAALITCAIIFWLWYSTTHELLEDEAYYWQWSRHLAVGYFDNTPMMAWIIALTTKVFGSTELGVRSGAVFCSAVCAWFVYKLALVLFDSSVALVSLTLMLCVPLTSAGAFMMTCDPPQMAFWAVTAYVAWNALQSKANSATSWRLWLLAGVFAGLAAMSKVNGLFVLPSILLFVCFERPMWKWLKQPEPYIASLITILIFSPFIWWNHTHGNAFWQHIHHMSNRADGTVLKSEGDYIGAQAALVSPFLFLSYVWIMATVLRSKAASPGVRYCWWLSVIVFLETGFVALRSKTEGNWAVAAYATGFILLANSIVVVWKAGRLRYWHGFSIGFAALMTLIVYVSTFTINALRIRAVDDKSDQMYGWNQISSQYRAELQKMGGDPFVLGVDYQVPSELAFYLPDQPTTYSFPLQNKGNNYEFWVNANTLVGRNAILAMKGDPYIDEHVSDARMVFDRVEIGPVLNIYRAGISEPIRTIHTYRCYGFRGYKREDWQTGY